MADLLPYGFKANAERLAEAIRSECGVGLFAPLDCTLICASLGIPIMALTDMVELGARPESVRRLIAGTSCFSAVTVFTGTKRIIVYNSAHPAGRRANSLAHELSHIFLEHPISSALGMGGCRRWDARVEAEADWQAGALLVPRAAALRWMNNGGDIDGGALHFGVSRALFTWRVSQTGVTRQLTARAAFLRPSRTA